MRRSIRGALFGWFGALLAGVLLSFGGMLYVQAADTAMAGVDAALTDRAHAIAGALDWEEDEEHHDGEGREPSGLDLELSADYLEALAADCDFRIWRADGSTLRAGGDLAPSTASGADGFHTLGDLRMFELGAPFGARVLVGRSIEPELARLASLRTRVVIGGLAVLALALAGGWWLARRSLAPVAAMTATAAGITERDLSARLDEERAPAELSGLARAFNGTLERLEAAFERQTRFTADASHELRTPVAVVRAQAEQALRASRTEDEYRAALAACARAAERMGRLVESLLALAREDGAPNQDRFQDVALDQLARESTALLRPLAADAHVELHCTTEPAYVRGDERLLADLVANLIDNGLRYNRAEGRVDVTVATENGHALVRVQDTGIGIAEEAQPFVFDRFYRVDPARSRANGGSGLGLAIARGIVDAHGGSIELESEPGAGSTFTLRLPVDREA